MSINSKGKSLKTETNKVKNEVEKNVNQLSKVKENLKSTLEKNELLIQEINQTKDFLLRLQAEKQNLVRRQQQELEKTHKFANENILNSFLIVLDSLEKTSQHFDSSLIEGKKNRKIFNENKEGINLVLKLFIDTLKKNGIEPINPIGEVFDPEKHNAVIMKSDDKIPNNHILEVLQKGFSLNNRVIRPAMVSVSKTN